MAPSISHGCLEALDGRSASRADRTASPGQADALVLPDGTRLRLRRVGPHDRDRLAKLFARLGPESRYRRFLLPKRELTPGELAALTDVDHLYHEAIAAVHQHDGSIVGVGHYAPRHRSRGQRERSRRGRRRVAAYGHRHGARQVHGAARSGERVRAAYRHDVMGEPARTRAAAKARVSRLLEPRRRDRARTPPRSGARSVNRFGT
jgi:hypothetical protein